MEKVHVWVAPLLVPHAVHTSLVATLSPTERARAARYHDAEAARRFSVARGWLRRVLAGELGTAPAAVPISHGSGKPRLSGLAGPCFNLSHAGELAVVAVADREVGVDIEPTDVGAGLLHAVPLACTPSEVAALDRLLPRLRVEAFLRLWTAKEAYLKARGVGLTVAPDAVEIDKLPGPWSVRALQPADGYVGAVAAEGTDWTVELRSATEGASMVGP